MIASKQQSHKHGPGRLMVDGRDTTVVRKATFAFRPCNAQAGRLHGLLRISCEVYNAALQERRDAWRLARTTIRWQDQFVQIKHLRGVRDDALSYGIQPLRGAILRVDEAMQGFFQGIGTIRLPKSARRQLARMTARGGRAVTLTVTRRRAGSGWVWRASVAFADIAVEPTTPTHGENSLAGGDRGVKVTIATSNGQMLAMPRHVAAAREHLADLETGLRPASARSHENGNGSQPTSHGSAARPRTRSTTGYVRPPNSWSTTTGWSRSKGSIWPR
jgi:putative transposase